MKQSTPIQSSVKAMHESGPELCSHRPRQLTKFVHEGCLTWIPADDLVNIILKGNAVSEPECAYADDQYILGDNAFGRAVPKEPKTTAGNVLPMMIWKCGMSTTMTGDNWKAKREHTSRTIAMVIIIPPKKK